MIRLEQLRIDAQLSPVALAAKANVSPVTVRGIESGKGAQVETLGKLAAVLGVKPSELLRPAAWPDPEPTEATGQAAA